MYIIALCLPLVFPIGWPIEITEYPTQFYNDIEALQPGDKIAYGFDVMSMTWMEQGLDAVPVSKHLFMQEGVKVFIFTVNEEGTMFWETTKREIEPEKLGKVYGEDYVFSGFLPGQETAVAAVANDVWKACNSVDAYGNKFEDLPMMEDIHSAEDFKLIINLCRGSPDYYQRQWKSAHGTPLYVLGLASTEATLMKYIQTGQVDGLLAGARRAAEYEILMGERGLAAAGMDAQTVGHYVFLLVIVIGNTVFLLSRQGRSRT
jgi:hypothetical protein